MSGLAAAYALAAPVAAPAWRETARAAFARGDVGVLEYFAEPAAALSFAERAP
jgi:hypothetical protein